MVRIREQVICALQLFIILFYLPHNNYKKYRKRRKKKWRGDLTETIGAYERLGLLELWARAVSHQLKKRRRKVEDGKIYKLFSYLLNNLIFSFFLKEERDWELMILLSSELKNLGPWKKGENFFVLLRQFIVIIAVLLIIERDRGATFAFCDKICGQTGSKNVQLVLQHCCKESWKVMLRVLPPTLKPVLQ